MRALGDLCEPVQTIDPRRHPAEEFVYIDISAVDRNAKMVTGARVIKGADAPTRARQRVREGDVLVSTTRPNLNAVALLAKSCENAVASTGFCVLRPNEQLDPMWLFLFTRTVGFIKALTGQTVGALYPAVNDRQVKAIRIPCPPIEQQRKLAARLSAHLEIADLILRRALAQKKGIEDAVPSATESILAEVVDRSNSVALDRILSRPLRAGLSKPCDPDSRFRVLSLSSVRDTELNLYATKPTNITKEDALKYKLGARNLYVVRGNGNASLVGRGALAPFDIPQNVIYPDLLIQVDTEIDVIAPEYLAILWHSRHVRRQIESGAKTSAGIFKINQELLRAVNLRVPGLDIQAQIIKVLEGIREKASSLSQLTDHQVSSAHTLKRTLLDETFRNEVGV